MSKTVDERVVEMRFDNRQFESNVKTSMSTLKKLKQSLKLTEVSKGLENISASARRVDMSPMVNGVEAVRMKFSALEVMAVTALANITNSVVNAGRRMVSAITIQPIKDGFAEYETQMNAVQTILANTQKEGTNVKIVNAALDDLNHYADKTIYNFTEMTRNIGTFTAAGVKLDTSVSAIKGIANLAAVSGSTSQQASTAMYQLSQALASGTVKLMDWNSVVNAGMGGQVFQDALIRTSEHLQTGAKAAIAAKGSFRESLQTGWLTTEVLTQTLDMFATAADTQEEYEAAVEKFVSQGYTQEEAKQMADMAKTAGDAATKVKTFSQLIDTLKEALGSGWTETWRMVVGDFEEAKALWTSVSDVLSDAINKSSDARNAIVKEWVDLGGRDDLIASFKNAFEGIISIVKPIKEAFRDIFPAITSKKLAAFTEGLKNITAKMKISDSTAAKLKSTFSGLFSVVSMFGKILGGVATAFGKLLTSAGVKALVDLFLSATAAIGDFLTALNKGFDSNGFTGVLTAIAGGISNVLKTAADGLSKFGSSMPKIGNGIVKVVSTIWNAFKDVFGWISDHFSAKDLFAGLAGGGIFVTAKKVIDLINTIKDKFEDFFGGGEGGDGLGGVADKFSDILDSVHDSLQSFTTGIKATTLLTIAAAIGILSASLKSIADLKGSDVAKSLTAIAAMFIMLNAAFKSINKTLDKYKPAGLVKAAASILLISFAIKTLASAMVKMSGLSWNEIVKGLFAIGVGLTELCLGLKAIDKVEVSISTSIAMLALAESCKILGDALTKFGGMSWSEIAHGLVGMGGALAELVIALKSLDKLGGMKSIFSSAGLLIAVQSLGKMADSLKKFGGMSWSEIARGLTGMGGALAEVASTVGVLGKIAGLKSIIGSGAILIVVQGLAKIAAAFKQFGGMSWDDIKHGLVGMGGALTELSVVSGLLGKLGGLSGLVGAGSIRILVKGLTDLASAFQQFGGMSWDDIKHGLVGMGGALTELSVVSGLLGKLGGLSGLVGAGSIRILVKGLTDLASAFQQFGGMSWDDIKHGLVGMGGALTELSVISGLLGGLGGLAGLVGAGSLLLAIQGLGDLADALKKFGSMSWSEIGHGLTAMGSALLELAAGSIVNSLSAIGGWSVSVAVQPLDELAEALKKFGEMSWDEIGRGLSAMDAALSKIAVGSLANTLSGLGALSISEIAEPLGTLADSVKKWSGVTVPEGLGEQLKNLASGVRSFTFDGLGASALSTAAEPLGTLADSVKKWSGVTVPEGLGEQLKNLASGVRSFTFDGLGASALSTAAPGIGDLAAAIKKWNGVQIPEGLEDGLTSIANGIKAFSLAFLGGWTLDAVTGPVGTLAGSIKKWNGVTIPEGLEDGLTEIANGIKAFSLAFLGGWTLDAVTGPIGTLAGSIKKWNGVQIPEGLEDGLTSIANGIKAFSLAFVGGWTLDAVTGPIGTLATSIKKWNGVTIPNNIGDQLSGLATGIKSFSGAENISSSVTSFGRITVAMSKLGNVNFEGVSNGITSVANAISNFATSANSISGIGESIINNIVVPIQNAGPQITGAVTTLMSTMSGIILINSSLIVAAFDTMMSSVMMSITSRQEAMILAGTTMMLGLSMGIIAGTAVVAETIANVMLQISTIVIGNMAIFAVAGVSLMSGLCIGIMTGVGLVNTALYSALSNAASILLSNLGIFTSAGIILMAGLQSGMLVGGVGIPVIIYSVITMGLSMALSSVGMFMSAGLQLMTGLRTGITGGMGTVLSAINTVTTRAYTMIMSKRGQFTNAGRSLIAGLATGLRTSVGLVNAAISSTMSGCAAAIRSHYWAFKSAGQYLGDGLCIGISLKTSAAYQAGFALGKAAVDGEKAGQQSRSPSKATKKAGKWLGEGLIIGMGQMSKSVYESGKAMGQNAVESISGALNKINTLSADGSEFAPTIRPVVDMDAFQNGSETLSIGANLSANLLSKPVATLQDLMTDTQANIDASNSEVIKAITDLRDDLSGYYSGDDSEIALYMDTKKVASTLAKPMNRQLNILSKRGAY